MIVILVEDGHTLLPVELFPTSCQECSETNLLQPCEACGNNPKQRSKYE